MPSSSFVFLPVSVLSNTPQLAVENTTNSVSMHDLRYFDQFTTRIDGFKTTIKEFKLQTAAAE